MRTAAIVTMAAALLQIRGQHNTVTTDEGGDASIRGNANALHSTGDLGAVSVEGNDNDVDADGELADLNENGNGNES